MIRRIVPLLFFCSALGITVANATQDSFGYGAVCVPEMYFLRIESMILANPDYIENADLLREQYGIFSISDRFECQLEDDTYVFELDNDSESGWRDNTVTLLLSVNGRQLFSTPFLDSRPRAPGRNHVFDVNRYSAEACVYGVGRETSCDRVQLSEFWAESADR